MDGWATGAIDGDSFWIGPVGGRIERIDLNTGQEVGAIQCNRTASIAAVWPDALLLSEALRCFAVDHAGRVVWELERPARTVTASKACFLATDYGREEIACVDRRTGSTLWTFKAPKEGKGGSDDTSNAVFGLAISEGRVIVVIRTGRVFALSLVTGEVMGIGRPECVGSVAITAASVFFKQPFGLSEFNHREMTETSRSLYRDAVEPLYGGNAPTVHAFVVTAESVVWTTAHGALMAVSRTDRGGRREVFNDVFVGALMPYDRPPMVFGDYLYCELSGAAAAVHCYRTAS